MTKKPHRTFSLPASSIERIAKIREQTEAASDSEVVRRALRLYEQLLETDKKGASKGAPK